MSRLNSTAGGRLGLDAADAKGVGSPERATTTIARAPSIHPTASLPRDRSTGADRSKSQWQSQGAPTHNAIADAMSSN